MQTPSDTITDKRDAFLSQLMKAGRVAYKRYGSTANKMRKKPGPDPLDPTPIYTVCHQYLESVRTKETEWKKLTWERLVTFVLLKLHEEKRLPAPTA